VAQQLLQKIKKTPGVWFARHEELAQWALASNVDEHTYRGRFFENAKARTRRPTRRR
jgi:hypothetical protein